MAAPQVHYFRHFHQINNAKKRLKQETTPRPQGIAFGTHPSKVTQAPVDIVFDHLSVCRFVSGCKCRFFYA
uniref:C3H1-type domain-containing protein n=1 Tax=Panagrellus redivivus TaxID=6233 RepID=A0A7E4W8D2_PANRE